MTISKLLTFGQGQASGSRDLSKRGGILERGRLRHRRRSGRGSRSSTVIPLGAAPSATRAPADFRRTRACGDSVERPSGMFWPGRLGLRGGGGSGSGGSEDDNGICRRSAAQRRRRHGRCCEDAGRRRCSDARRGGAAESGGGSSQRRHQRRFVSLAALLFSRSRERERKKKRTKRKKVMPSNTLEAPEFRIAESEEKKNSITLPFFFLSSLARSATLSLSLSLSLCLSRSLSVSLLPLFSRARSKKE